MTVNEAVAKVVSCCPNSYAKAYAGAMREAERRDGEYGRKIQVLYILNNMSHWRGDTAKQVRNVFKTYTKGM